MTVQAERLNFLRFLSHFRAVHRGASFAGLRTTSVRKLLPEYVLVPYHSRHKIELFSFPSLALYFLSHSPFPTYAYKYFFADLGDFCVLFTHLMGSHVGC